jgi:RND family efflux transporter MFP subunit
MSNHRGAGVPSVMGLSIAVFSCAALLAAMATSCAREPASVGDAVRTVRVVAVTRTEIADEVEGFGSLSYIKKVDIAAPSASVVAQLPHREGTRVGERELVARLTNPQIALAVGRSENAVSQAEAALDLAKAQLLEGKFSAEGRVLGLSVAEAELRNARRELAEAERKHSDQERLFEAGGVTEEAIRSGRFELESKRDSIAIMERELEISRVGLRDEDLVAAGLVAASKGSLEGAARLAALTALSTRSLSAEAAAAEARLEAAKKELESARLAEAELEVTSPTAGIVGALYVEEGERVEAEAKLLTVIESKSLYAVFPVREGEAPRLRAGMAALVRVDAASATVNGVVELVSPVADSQSASFQVRVRLKGGGALKPGMFARAVVTVGPPRVALVIPESAAMDRRAMAEAGKGGSAGERARVFTVVEGKATEREVVLGAVTEEGREVVEGLAENEVVVDRPDSDLKEGERVVVE